MDLCKYFVLHNVALESLIVFQLVGVDVLMFNALLYHCLKRAFLLGVVLMTECCPGKHNVFDLIIELLVVFHSVKLH